MTDLLLLECSLLVLLELDAVPTCIKTNILHAPQTNQIPGWIRSLIKLEIRHSIGSGFEPLVELPLSGNAG